MAVGGSGLTLGGGELRLASLGYSSSSARTFARTSANVADETRRPPTTTAIYLSGLDVDVLTQDATLGT